MVSAAFFCLSHLPLVGQQPSKWQQWRSLTPPVRTWVLSHPLVAAEALRISNRTRAITDSIATTTTIGTDANGGCLDAFRHATWMSLLTLRIGPRRALSLGKAYERGNKYLFRRHGTEDGSIQDAAASEMDLRNNTIGIEIGKDAKSEAQCITAVLSSLPNRTLWCIAKDQQGNPLDDEGHPIPTHLWLGLWENARTLQPCTTCTTTGHAP